MNQTDIAINSKDVDIVRRYTNQPSMLPDTIRQHVENKTAGEPVQLYAYADLDSRMMLGEQWVAITASHLLIIDVINQSPSKTTLIDRQQIQSIVEKPGLSCTVMVIQAKGQNNPLAVVRYTHRQRQAMENISLVIKQSIKGVDLQVDAADDKYAHAVADPVRKAQASVTINRLAVVWRLLSYLHPYRNKFLLGMAAAIAMTLLTLLSPFLTMYLIDDIYHPFVNGAISRSEALKLSGIIIAILAVAYVLREIFHWTRLRIMSVLGEYVARDLRRELYAHIQQLSMGFFTKKQTGSLISRVSHDTDRLWDFLAFGVVEVTLAALMIVGLSVVLLILDWRLGLIITLPLPVFMWSFYKHSKTLNNLFIRAWRKWSNLTEVLSDTIPGIRVVKAFNQEHSEIQRFNDRNDVCLNEFNDIHHVWTKFWPRILFSLHVIVLAVWVFAMPRLLNNAGVDLAPLSFGTFLAFLLYLGMFFQPMETIGMLMRMMNRATSSALRIFEILDTEPEIKTAKDPVVLEPVKGEIEFKNVSFAYDGIRHVLRNIDFKVNPGEMIGLVGESGAGKSTVTSLMANFYTASSGHILIDGVDINQLDIGHYRQQIGMVLQDPFLFHGSILDNIRYGHADADLDRVIAAARAANAHDFICKLAHGYETVVGERGHSLSGGERQRISIARAILTDPKILILDEATSSVDTITERNIQDALDRLIEGRTVFAIAHRLSTLRRADRLFVFEDGRIIEQGTHAELLQKKSGTYRKLSQMQREIHDFYAV